MEMAEKGQAIEEQNRKQGEPLLQSPKIGVPEDINKIEWISSSSTDQVLNTSRSSHVLSPGGDHAASQTSKMQLLSTGSVPRNSRRPGSTSESQRVTLTGTVTQGISAGQPVEVEMDLNHAEFLRLTSTQPPEMSNEESRPCSCSRGPHVVVWSVLCFPVAMVISLVLAFYNGAITWHNLVLHLAEEKTWLHRLTLCPLLILSFPATVGLTSLALALVAMVMQVSWDWSRWRAEIVDGEKGFYGWLCAKLGLDNCSPYQVVVFDDSVI